MQPHQPPRDVSVPTKTSQDNDVEKRFACEKYKIPGLDIPVMGDSPPSAKCYYDQLAVLKDIITKDQLGAASSSDPIGSTVPQALVDQWVPFLGHAPIMPSGIKGLYNKSLQDSAPIELARSSLRFIHPERKDVHRLREYSERGLLALSTLGDLKLVEEREPLIAAVALWVRANLLVRHPDGVERLRTTLEAFGRLRPKVNVSENKVPTSEVLIARLKIVAMELGEANADVAWWSQFGTS